MATIGRILCPAMDWYQVAALALSVIGTVVATGLVIVLMIQRATTEAGNDRRAFQAGMDDFRREMLRLAERQARIEGNPAE